MSEKIERFSNGKKNQLSDLEKLFVSAYLISFNKSKAAKDAGYKGTNHGQRGIEIYSRPRVMAAINKHIKELVQKNDAEVGYLIQKAKQMLNFDPGQLLDEDGEVLPVNKLPESVRLVIVGVEIEERFDIQRGHKIRTYKYKFESRQGSLDKLFRFHAMYNDTLKLDTRHDIRVVYEKPPVTAQEPKTILSTQN